MTNFNSLDFCLFLVVFALVLQLATATRAIMLVGSIIFAIVATNEYVIAVLLIIAITSWALGRLLPFISSHLFKALFLTGGLVAVWFVALLSSRYDWLQAGGELLIGRWELANRLPLRQAVVVWSSTVGISFVALRLTCYLVDSWWRDDIIDLKNFLLYIFYFPAYIAGPIERPSVFADRVKYWQRPKSRKVFDGIDRFVSGLFKKFVVADLIYPYSLAQLSVDFSTSWQLCLGILAYSLYIYWEFSGYTDIALGVSACLGIELPENFDRPYTKTDLSEFWNSWHMSFSFWLRDYIFSPLNLVIGRRFAKSSIWGTALALLVTMSLCGLWHGYTTSFLIWGIHHGLGLGCHRVYQSFMQKKLGRKGYRTLATRRLYRICCWATTFLFVSLGWIWFALPLEQAVDVWRKLGGW